MDTSLSRDQFFALGESVRPRMNYLYSVRVQMYQPGAV
jgi:hypothetical protein